MFKITCFDIFPFMITSFILYANMKPFKYAIELIPNKHLLLQINSEAIKSYQEPKTPHKLCSSDPRCRVSDSISRIDMNINIFEEYFVATFIYHNVVIFSLFSVETDDFLQLEFMNLNLFSAHK